MSEREPTSAEPTSAAATDAAAPAAAPRPRVGFWFGLLLLFVPIAYPLLYLKRYSLWARLGWGFWLSVILLAKFSGFSEPVLDLKEVEEQVLRQERREEQREQRGGDQADRPARRGARETFIQPDEQPRPPPPLERYLRELGGGLLGRTIREHSVDGGTIRIAFAETDWLIDDESAIALESIGAALSLFYGRDFERIELDFVLRGRPVHVALDRAAFNTFFGLSENQVRMWLSGPERREASPFREENLPPEQQRAFFEQFAEYR